MADTKDIFTFNSKSTKDKDNGYFEHTKKSYQGVLNALGIKGITLDEIEAGSKVKDGTIFNKFIENWCKDNIADQEIIKDYERREKAESDKEVRKNIKKEKTDYLDEVNRSYAKEKLAGLKGKVNNNVKMYLSQMATSYIPYDTVFSAGIILGRNGDEGNKSLQMGCGQGKTGVVAFAAYDAVQNDEQIFVTSSTQELADESFFDTIKFYDNLGKSSEMVLISPEGLTTPKLDENGKLVLGEKGVPVVDKVLFEGKSEQEKETLLKEAYGKEMIMADNATLMDHAMGGYIEPKNDNKHRRLLADEADYVLLDTYKPKQQTYELSSEEIAERETLRGTAYSILEKLKGLENYAKLIVKDDETEYVDFTQTGRAAMMAEIKTVLELEEGRIDPNQLADFVHDALVVDTLYRENRDYQILNNGQELISENRASGVRIPLPQGIEQALQIKLMEEGRYTGLISAEKGVKSTINVQSFFKEYFNDYQFISGTLGIESDEVAAEFKENFGIDIAERDVYNILPREENKRKDQGKTMYSLKEEKHKAIIDSALGEIDNQRSVLIGVVSEEELNELYEKISEENSRRNAKLVTVREYKENDVISEEKGENSNLRILKYTAASKKIFEQDKESMDDDEFKKTYGVDKSECKNKTYSEFIKDESGKPDTITIGTSIMGRGTTIKAKEVNENGGIHVIIDGMHETSSRNQEQYKARTARGDNEGTTVEMFCPEDIPTAVRGQVSLEGKSADQVYNDVYKVVDAKTSSSRELICAFIEKSKNAISKISVLEELGGVSKEITAKNTALAYERAFSIMNRACGVNNTVPDRIAEYEKEIEVYSRMYVAKSMAEKDEKPFDEKQWLVDKKYIEMAQQHFPFDKQREDEILQKNGFNVGDIREGIEKYADKETIQSQYDETKAGFKEPEIKRNPEKEETGDDELGG